MTGDTFSKQVFGNIIDTDNIVIHTWKGDRGVVVYGIRYIQQLNPCIHIRIGHALRRVTQL